MSLLVRIAPRSCCSASIECGTLSALSMSAPVGLNTLTSFMPAPLLVLRCVPDVASRPLTREPPPTPCARSCGQVRGQAAETGLPAPAPTTCCGLAASAYHFWDVHAIRDRDYPQRGDGNLFPVAGLPLTRIVEKGGNPVERGRVEGALRPGLGQHVPPCAQRMQRDAVIGEGFRGLGEDAVG